MHTNPMAETDGDFKRVGYEGTILCPECKRHTIYWRLWQSNCGGYVDVKYKCHAPDCGHSWWVDGAHA
jgi:DNA-directed RNA polymerase subunit M/transcription elongation factor TFIIS